MIPEDVDLHDARLINLAVDYARKTVSLKVDMMGKDCTQGKLATINFENVEQLSHIGNLVELHKHNFAGHISYWKASLDHKIVYIYLAAGCIAIASGSVGITWED